MEQWKMSLSVFGKVVSRQSSVVSVVDEKQTIDRRPVTADLESLVPLSALSALVVKRRWKGQLDSWTVDSWTVGSQSAVWNFGTMEPWNFGTPEPSTQNSILRTQHSELSTQQNLTL